MYALRAICSAIVQRKQCDDDVVKHLYEISEHDPWIQRLGVIATRSSPPPDRSLEIVDNSSLIESISRKRKRDNNPSMLNMLARKYLRLEKESKLEETKKEDMTSSSKSSSSSAPITTITTTTATSTKEIETCCDMLREYSNNIEMSQSDTNTEKNVVNYVTVTLRNAGGSCFRETCKKIMDAVPFENLDLVLSLCRAFLTSDLSPADATCFVSLLLLPLVKSLKRPASRSLYCAVVSASENHPSALVDALVMPILSDEMGRPQVELIKRIVREHLVSTSSVLLDRVVQTTWSDSMLPIVQTLLNLKNLSISESLMSSTIRRLDLESQRSSTGFTKSVKFAAVLNTVVKKFGSKLNSSHISQLRRILGRCTAFMAKVALKSLSRLDNDTTS